MCKQRVIIIRYLAVRLLPFDFDFGLIYVSILFYPAVRSTFFLFFSLFLRIRTNRIESKRLFRRKRDIYIYNYCPSSFEKARIKSRDGVRAKIGYISLEMRIVACEDGRLY